MFQRGKYVDVMNFVTYEDRPNAMVSVKLLALSLDRHARGSCLYFFTKNEDCGLSEWAEERLKYLKLIVRQIHSNALSGWSMKPRVLLEALNITSTTVFWLDTDVLAIRDLDALFRDCNSQGLVLCTKKGIHDKSRTEVWGLKVTKILNFSINTAILGVSKRHIPLLELWDRYLNEELFQNEQKKPPHDRRAALYGDQDVLEGLLCTDLVDPQVVGGISIIKGGVQVLHESDFSIYQRLISDGSKFFFVHSQGIKPWNVRHKKHLSLKDKRVLLSAYIFYAGQFADEISETELDGWFSRSSIVIALSKAVFFNHPIRRSILIRILQSIYSRRSRIIPKRIIQS